MKKIYEVVKFDIFAEDEKDRVTTIVKCNTFPEALKAVEKKILKRVNDFNARISFTENGETMFITDKETKTEYGITTICDLAD